MLVQRSVRLHIIIIYWCDIQHILIKESISEKSAEHQTDSSENMVLMKVARNHEFAIHF